jgi:CRP-like cAMP-binding protein
LTSIDNALIGQLDGAERARFLADCERVPLQKAHNLFHLGETIRDVYFPVDGFVCLFAQEPNTLGMEIAMVGREGMLDVRAVLGVARTAVRACVQGEGSAWRMPADVFQRHLQTSATLKRLLDRYVAVVLSQAATLALCLRYHEVGARLARWLLMCQDRTGANHCRITQASLGTMLGVRRVSITTAANALQQCGAITYQRGEIHLLDRDMLEKQACSCYRTDRESYEGLLSPSEATGQ